MTLNKRFDEYDAQEERIKFLRKRCKELYQAALLKLMNSAQWDLIKCQKWKEGFDKERGENFNSSIEKHWSRQKKRGLYALKIIMIFMY